MPACRFSRALTRYVSGPDVDRAEDVKVSIRKGHRLKSSVGGYGRVFFWRERTLVAAGPGGEDGRKRADVVPDVVGADGARGGRREPAS